MPQLSLNIEIYSSENKAQVIRKNVELNYTNSNEGKHIANNPE